MDTEKPIPSLTDSDTLSYWRAAKEHRLALQHCGHCDKHLYPPGPSCPVCGSPDVHYRDMGSDITGRLYSYIVTHRAFVQGFAKDAPYIVALVEIDGLPLTRILANLNNCSVERVKIGMPVKMVWEDRTPEVSLPQWEPAG